MPSKSSEPALKTRHLELAEWVNDSYHTEPTFKSFWTETEVHVRFREEATWVCFRGSEPKLIEWLLNFLAVTYKGKHLGFWLAYLSVRNRVKQLIHMASDRDSKLVITGHSKGAALAEFLATDFENYRDTELVTFACPRVSTSRYQSSVNFVVEGDWIPGLAPWHQESPNRQILGRVKNPLKAHSMSTYESLMREAGSHFTTLDRTLKE